MPIDIFDRLADFVDDINSLGSTSSAGVNSNARTTLTGRVNDTVKTVIFPTTPTINMSQSVNYSGYNLTHTNYTVQSYVNSPSPVIQVTGSFPTHSKEEHEYARDVITFFRTVTKMHYGRRDSKAGTPPPVCRFSSNGKNMFQNVPVLVGSFSIPLDGSTDQIYHDGTALPAIMQVTCDLLVHINPAKQKEDFSIKDFSSGKLFKDGFI